MTVARIEGTWQALGSRDARWVLDYTVATPVAGATTTTASGSMTLELSGPITAQLAAIVFWDGTLRGPGHDDGASITGSSGQVVHTFTQTVTLGSAPSSRTYSFWWASQSPSVALVFPAWTSDGGMGSATIPLPARVYDPPSPPTGVARSRVGDSTWDVTWSHAGGTGAAPLAGFEARRVSGRAGSVLTFAASIGAAARSVRDTGAQVDDRIVYEVRAVGPTGLASAWVAAPAGWTTPAAPSGVTPTRTASGVDVAWTVAAFDASAQRVQAQSSTDGVTYGAWADVSGHTGLVASVVSRSLTSLSTVQWHRVRVVSQVTTPAALESASVASVVIAPVQAPAAPALLGPSVTQSTVTDGVLLSWVHASLDTSRQVAYEVQHRPTGGAWTTLSGGVDEFRRLTLAAGTYGWRARTKGQHVDWSPWSSVGVFTVAQPPAVSITAPTDASTIGSNRLTLTVAYTDPQSAAMTGWRAELLEGGQVIETLTGSGAVSSVTFATLLEYLTSYAATFWATAGTGLQSATASVSVSVDFLPPPTPVLTASWDEPSGTTQLTVAVPAPGVGEAAANYSRIERSDDDDGTTWTVIADDLPPDAGVGDDTAPLNDTLMYRAVSVSALGTEAVSVARVVETPSYRVWLRTTDGDTLMLAHDIQVTGSDGHEVVIEDYFGYTKPTAHFGEKEPTTVQVTARVARGYGIEQNRKKFLRKPVFYRDPFGRAFWATLTPGGIQMAQSSTSLGVISFTVEEITND